MLPVWDHILRTTFLDYWQRSHLPITQNFNSQLSHHCKPVSKSWNLRSVEEEMSATLPWFRFALKCLAFFSLLISIFYSYETFTSVLFQGRRSIINPWHTHPILLLMFYWYWSIWTMGLQTCLSESWWKLSTLPVCVACPCDDWHNPLLHSLLLV